MTAGLHPVRRPALVALILVYGCASPPPPDPADGPCAACEFSFRLCLEKDDLGPCTDLRRFCYGWCGEAASCGEGCEGAMWGCAAARTQRSTCDRIAEACPAWCGVADEPEPAE